MEMSGGNSTPTHCVDLVVGVISNSLRTKVENPSVFYKLCLHLASCIDLAITNKEVPKTCRYMPQLLKQLYICKKGSSLGAAFTVLMLSVKSAQSAGWFSNEDAYFLDLMMKMALKDFCNPEDANIEPSCARPYILNILSRCKPQMKMEKIIVSLIVQAGFGVYVSDFSISKNTFTSQHEKMCLFVSSVGDADLTSPMETPSQIELLLNGQTVRSGIEGIGQVLVINVSAMLEDGVNLLQAVGQFSGSYVIALATTSIILSSGNSELHDSNQQSVASVSSGVKDQESEPSTKNCKTSCQISLECPISRRRINLPAKGNLCKHLECFDYESFLKINSEQRSWQCPICKQPVGSTDLRVDQRYFKILKEAPVHVNNVIISNDGSWEPVPGEGDRSEHSLWSDMLQTVSLAVGKVPVLSTDSNTTRGYVKPNNNAPLNRRPVYHPLQHHSKNQPNAVQSTKKLPSQGPDQSRSWISQQHFSSTADQRMLEPNIFPTQDGNVPRMRGSLTGQAYDDALNRVMSPPIQPAAGSRPRPTIVPVHLPPPARALGDPQVCDNLQS